MTTSTENSYANHAENIIDRYKEFVDHTRKSVFPRWNFPIVETPDLQGLSKFQASLAKLLSPYIILNEQFSPTIIIWYFVFLVWAVVIAAHLQMTLHPALPGANDVPNPINHWVGLFVLFLFTIPPMLLYGYTAWFLISKRNSWKTRVAWLALSSLLLFYLYLQSLQMNPNEIAAVTSPIIFKFVLYWTIIPALLFIVFNILFAGKFIIELIINVANSFMYANQPVMYWLLREMSATPIKSTKADWKLSELGLQEIRTLKELAKNNLDAAEKKTIPTAILIATVGLLATAPVFQDIFGAVIKEILNRTLEVFFVSGNAADMTFGRIAFDLAIVFIITIIIASYMLLFQNLLIQGVIVQVCTVAEHAQRQMELKALQNQEREPLIQLLLKELKAFINSILRK